MAEQAKGKHHLWLKSPGKRLTFIPEDTRPRVLLFFFAVVLQLIASGVSGVGFTLNGPNYWLAGTVLWALWLVLMFFIVTPRTDTLLQRHTGFLRRGATIIFIAVLLMGIAEAVLLGFYSSAYMKAGEKNIYGKLVEQMQHGFQYNDGTALSQQAAENLLKGENPYANANIVTALEAFHGAYDRVTPLRVGRFAAAFPYPTTAQLKELWDAARQNPSPLPPELESQVCYPAGSFLLVAPFIAAGIKDIRFIYFIFVIAGLVYAAWRIPGRKKFLFIALVLVSLELWNTLAVGETGIMIFPMLLIAWIALGENNWLSAIFMGLAVATKQTAWFFLLFYLILLWRTGKQKTLAATIGIIAAVFVVTNGYFIAKNPGLWLDSVASPMVEPMFPLGVGLITIVTGGFVHIQSSLPFTAMELIVLVGAVVWYYRNCRRYPEAGLMLAVLPLFFAYRSLWTYFFYVTIIILSRMLIKSEAIPAASTPRLPEGQTPDTRREGIPQGK